jgi:hypothetical protein
MAQTNSQHGSLAAESDGIYITFVRDCDGGLAAESKWMSASVARDFVVRGFAVESDPAPKQ